MEQVTNSQELTQQNGGKSLASQSSEIVLVNSKPEVTQKSDTEIKETTNEKTNVQEINQQQQIDINNNVNLQIQSESIDEMPIYKIHTKLLNVFYNIKQRTAEDHDAKTKIKKKVPLEESIENICKIDIVDIVTYIEHMVEIILDLKDELQQEIDKKVNSECSDYEQQLQKLEAEIRNHIRIEQQLKLYFENTQTKLEDQEREKNDEISKLQNQIQELKNQIQQLDQTVKQNEIKYDDLKQDNQLKNELVKQISEKLKFQEEQFKSSKDQLKYSQNQIGNEEKTELIEQISKIQKQNAYLNQNNSLSRFKVKQIRSTATIQKNYDKESTLYQYFQDKISKKQQEKVVEPTQFQKKIQKLQEILDKKSNNISQSNETQAYQLIQNNQANLYKSRNIHSQSVDQQSQFNVSNNILKSQTQAKDKGNKQIKNLMSKVRSISIHEASSTASLQNRLSKEKGLSMQNLKQKEKMYNGNSKIIQQTDNGNQYIKSKPYKQYHVRAPTPEIHNSYNNNNNNSNNRISLENQKVLIEELKQFANSPKYQQLNSQKEAKQQISYSGQRNYTQQ